MITIKDSPWVVRSDSGFRLTIPTILCYSGKMKVWQIVKVSIDFFLMRFYGRETQK